MKVLGIETSCDETAVCLIEASGTFGRDFQFKVLGNALLSQANLHAQYGGVYPNLAKREHTRNLVPLLSRAFKDSGLLKEALGAPAISPEKIGAIEKILAREPELFAHLAIFLAGHTVPDIDAIAVTMGPGLEPALWVGINFAKALSFAWSKPIVAVDHMEAHIMLSSMHMLAPFQSGKLAQIHFPLLALLISGGHTELILSKEWMHYRRIGQTRDDSVGEAFDKVARMLALPYPGGPEISRLAEEARSENMNTELTLPRPMMKEDNFDFSFAGLKTAVRKFVDANPDLNDVGRMKVALEFEDAATDVLVSKTLRAVEEFGAGTVVIGGGVSANNHIRLRLHDAIAEFGGTTLLVPPPELATDNAIMIALAGYFHAQKKEYADPSTLNATGNLRLGSA